MLAIWPISNSLAPFVVFIVINGLGNGGFFSTIPSVVGHIYGPTRVPTALAMVVSAWAAGYIMVSLAQHTTLLVIFANLTAYNQGAPVAGYILESYGGSDSGRAAFRPAMYYAGSMSVGSAAFTLTIRQLMTKKFLAFA